MTVLVGLFGAAAACDRTPTDVEAVTPPGQFTQVSAGTHHACAVDTIGRGWCWGDNGDGQTGVAPGGCQTCVSPPVLIQTELRFAMISAGGDHACGIATSGAAYCWGNNDFGQLGATAPSSCNVDGVTLCSAVPLAVTGGHSFKSIVAGSYGTCGITLGDVVKCWGFQGFASNPFVTSPTTVKLGADSTWSQVGHTDGGLTGCGSTLAGVTACWGSNFYGQLGVGVVSTTRSSPTPIVLAQPVKHVSSGSGFSCALTTAGDVYCWGLSVRGALGLGGDAPGTACNAGATATCYPTPLKVVGNRHFASLAVGAEHVCGLEAISGDAYCWGANTLASIGNASLRTDQIAPSPFLAAGGQKFTALSAGTRFTCGLREDRNIFCWGGNFSGELGTSLSLFYSAVPQRVVATNP